MPIPRIERSCPRSKSRWFGVQIREVSAADEVWTIRNGTVDMNEFYNINNDIDHEIVVWPDLVCTVDDDDSIFLSASMILSNHKKYTILLIIDTVL